MIIVEDKSTYTIYGIGWGYENGKIIGNGFGFTDGYGDGGKLDEDGSGYGVNLSENGKGGGWGDGIGDGNGYDNRKIELNLF